MRFVVLFILSISSFWSSAQETTYCNPVDIDYTYMSHYRAERDVSLNTS